MMVCCVDRLNPQLFSVDGAFDSFDRLAVIRLERDTRSIYSKHQVHRFAHNRPYHLKELGYAH